MSAIHVEWEPQPVSFDTKEESDSAALHYLATFWPDFPADISNAYDGCFDCQWDECHNRLVPCAWHWDTYINREE